MKYYNFELKLTSLQATCPRDECRDEEEAVKLAHKACELISYDNNICLAVLAAAYEKEDKDAAGAQQRDPAAADKPRR